MILEILCNPTAYDIIPKGNIIPVGDNGGWAGMDEDRYAEKRLDVEFLIIIFP